MPSQHEHEFVDLSKPVEGKKQPDAEARRGFLSKVTGLAALTAMAPDKAIVISTHILEEVDAVCTRAIIIARGRVIVDAPPRELERDGRSLEQVFRDLTLGEGAAPVPAVAA